jgi:hypothetical protein
MNNNVTQPARIQMYDGYNQMLTKLKSSNILFAITAVININEVNKDSYGIASSMKERCIDEYNHKVIGKIRKHLKTQNLKLYEEIFSKYETMKPASSNSSVKTRKFIISTG